MKRYSAKQFLAICIGVFIAQTAFGAEQNLKTISFWLPLAQDELHDPANPALNLLQNPTEALSGLPGNVSGDQVNWGKALENGNIKPRISIRSNTQEEVLDLNILLKNTNEMGMVSFSHKQHTEWLACNNCHDEIFKSKVGATKFGMLDNLNGEYCGRCHGAVAFPLTECNRCHSVPRTPIAVPARRIE
jgi:c(7)-type cytochrome triheme protein